MNVVLKVNGMECEACGKKIRRALGMFEGYEGAKVDLEKGEVSINYEAPATVGVLIAAIEDAGYTVEQ
ncbi:MAG: heavy-metal-associated domain-containing protein [Clostridia bacterium]|nr:heavy-metal-associated domain-containing protein [Clostridia bacterium]